MTWDLARRVELTDGSVCLIDEEDWDRVRELTLYRGANGYVYFSTMIDGSRSPRTLHGFLMSTPQGMHTDHINGDLLDNRRSVNLRVVTPQVNQLNRRKLNRNNTTGVRGVVHYPARSGGRPWEAHITVNRKNLCMGRFATREEAVAARKAAEAKFYPESCPAIAPSASEAEGIR